jgi:DNA-binding SARP family transcriptional activator
MSEGDGELEFRILGPLEARRDGAAVALGAPKQRALLALLLLRAGEVVSTDRLIDELWGESPPKGAAHTVQVFVSRLRKALGGDALLTRAPGYSVAGQVDFAQFQALVASARAGRETGDTEQALTSLRQALSLWQGPPLAEFSYELFAAPHIQRLEEERLAALEERIELELELGHHARLVGELEELCHAQPLRERPHALLMLALYRSGRQSEALDLYRGLRTRLDGELGLQPGAALQALERRILQQDETLTADPGPRRRLPEGTVTFLFTDIEGSTRLLHELGPDAYAQALAEYRRVLHEAFAGHQGVLVDTQGDALFAAFAQAQERWPRHRRRSWRWKGARSASGSASTPVNRS